MQQGKPSTQQGGDRPSHEVRRQIAERDVRDLQQQVAERTRALQMLCDVASMANRAQDVEEAFGYCLRRVGEYNGWDFGHAYLPSADDPDLLLPAYTWYGPDAARFQAFEALTLRTPLRRGHGRPGVVYESGEPQWSTDIRAAMDVRRVDLAEALKLATTATFPVMAEDRVVAILEFFSHEPVEPKAEVFESMASVGTQLGRVIERKTFQDRLLTLSEDEHRRIGQELHDDVGQELTGLALKAETLAEMLQEQDTPASKLARDFVVTLDRTRAKVRAISRGLVPTEVDGPGLPTALEELSHRVGEGTRVACVFHCAGDPRIADCRTATQLYHIAQEAVANAIHCEESAKVDISLRGDEGVTLLEICNDGPRMLPAAARGDGVGLQIMRYRAGLIGATLAIESFATGGVRVTCRLPQSTT